MRQIDADELKRQLRGLYHPYSDELYRVESVIDRVPEYKLPPKQTYQSDDRWYRGYAAGWNDCRKEMLDNDPV